MHRIRRFPENEFSGPSSALPELEKFAPVDPSNTTLVMATIELSDATSTELVTAALTELKSLKERLKGVVDLMVPDRLSFDTRVK
jgi:mediator of RNA polymerase II transcription subunit 18